MKKVLIIIPVLLLIGFGIFSVKSLNQTPPIPLTTQVTQSHWLVLHRKSNIEYLFYGVPGDANQSELLKTFKVKTGIPGERPTPIPQLLGQNYWLITEKFDSSENPDTAPFFLKLNVPAPSEQPFGPSPYTECNGQCNWILPGAFGLHGVAGDSSKLSDANPGSSGCIRHSDEDITFLYNTLDPAKEETRYYIEDL
jgi:lipoprotein-anchoring transpeptidase ErfK/SrfK